MKIYKGKVIGFNEFTSKKGEDWTILFVTYGKATEGQLCVRLWTHNGGYKVGDVVELGDDGYSQKLIERE